MTAASADPRGATLLALARGAIERRLGMDRALPGRTSWLDEPAATFVTLTQQGQLRGCIGSLQAHRPLHEDVTANAVAAALHDPRFSPLSVAELPVTRIEVSLLSGLSPLEFASEQEALAQLQPGIDGLVLGYGGARGTFLPQVWEALPRPADFLAQLKRKAGLSVDFWDEAVSLQRYTVSKWREPVAGGQHERV